MADGGVARGRVFRGAVEPLASYRQVILLYGPIKYMHQFAELAHPASDFEASNRKHGMPVGSGRLAAVATPIGLVPPGWRYLLEGSEQFILGTIRVRRARLSMTARFLSPRRAASRDICGTN